MKTMTLVKTGILVLFVIIMTMVVLSSCEDNHTPPSKIERITVLKTNTVSFVRIPKAFDSVYREGDTVKVNLFTHNIDETDSNTVLCVIYTLKSVK